MQFNVLPRSSPFGGGGGGSDLMQKILGSANSKRAWLHKNLAQLLSS